MIYISHRGNINVRIEEKENTPSYIKRALTLGYDVEVDVWDCGEDGLLLGHDTPEYPIEESFLKSDHIWCHAKNIYTLETLLQLNVHCFFHNIDDCTLTSRNKIWIYPNKALVKNSIAVLPEITNYSNKELSKCYGICSDNIEYYKKKYETNPTKNI